MSIGDSTQQFRHNRNEFFNLSTNLESLSRCKAEQDPEKYKKQLKDGYETLKFSTGGETIEDVINKIGEILSANINETSEKHFHKIEEGLDILRRNIHVLSQSERNFFTKFIIRYFPKWNYSIKESKKEHDLFKKAQLFYRVSLGKDEREVFHSFQLNNYKSPVVNASRNAAFKEISGSILSGCSISSGSHGIKLSDLHQAVMKAYLKNKQNKEDGKEYWNLETIEDFYTAIILGGEEHLKSQDIGFLRDLSLNGIGFYNLDSHAAYTFIAKAFCTIHGETPEKSDIENAKYFEKHYASKGSKTRNLLSRARRRVITHKDDPAMKVELVAELIQDHSFQRAAVYHLKNLLNGEVPFEARIQTYHRWISTSMDEYYANKSLKKRVVIDADAMALFNAAAWIAANTQLEPNTIHQLGTLLKLYGLVEPTGKEQHMLSSILTGLAASTEVFAKLPQKSISK